MERLLMILVSGLALTNCSRSNAAEKRDPVPVASLSAARYATAPMAQNPRDINALFQNEAANRPAGGLRAEDTLAAFHRAGIELSEERQHLARPYGARYCMGAFAAGRDLALSVCEYVDTTAAQAGAAASGKIALKNREIRLNRATSLTIREINKTPESDGLSTRIFDNFAKL
jgi:hypothetical protein